jgi:hypothetical protein
VFFNFIFVQDGTHNSLFFTILYVILVHCTVGKGFFLQNFRRHFFRDIFAHLWEEFKVNIICSTESIFPTEWPAPCETHKLARQSVCNVKSMTQQAAESLVITQLAFIHDRHDYYSGIKAYSKIKFSTISTTCTFHKNKLVYI